MAGALLVERDTRCAGTLVCTPANEALPLVTSAIRPWFMHALACNARCGVCVPYIDEFRKSGGTNKWVYSYSILSCDLKFSFFFIFSRAKRTPKAEKPNSPAATAAESRDDQNAHALQYITCRTESDNFWHK